MNARPLAAVVGVGTELVTGLRVDTNTTEIASELTARGYRVLQTLRLADDVTLISMELRHLIGRCELVIVTGGLGPTHDDVTREAASQALGAPLIRDPSLVGRLREIGSRHNDPTVREQLLRQADVITGAEVIPATTGTAPGQMVVHGSCTLALLPGPPHEMRPMLLGFLDTLPAASPVRLRCAGITESDAQVTVLDALSSFPGIELTVLASPSEVEVVLFDDGAGRHALMEARDAIRTVLGDACYSEDGATLAATVIRSARSRGATISLAESCTGGMIAASLTDVPGASDVFAGGLVTYSNEAKMRLASVKAETLETYGAVSSQTAQEMAIGTRLAFDTDIALAVTGIAGPQGGTPAKPVGTVWFGMSDRQGCATWQQHFPGDRTGVRLRSSVQVLDALRRWLAGD